MNASPADSRVLIVEDAPANIQALTAILREKGYAISIATNGRQALDVLATVRPDLILLDVMMPVMSGFQACAKLKQDPATRDIPVIMVTALNETGDAEKAIDSGADDFLTKPVNKLELLTRVRSLLRVRLLKKELDRAHEQLRSVGIGLSLGR